MLEQLFRHTKKVIIRITVAGPAELRFPLDAAGEAGHILATTSPSVRRQAGRPPFFMVEPSG
jgi:hypothetical protein